MEQQKQSQPMHKPHPEPGRRYVGARATPSRGTAGRRSTHRELRHVPPSTATHLDVIPQTPKKQRTLPAVKPALPRTSRSFVLKRHIVEHAKAQRKKMRKTRGNHLVGYAVVGVVMLAGGVIVWTFQGLLPFDVSLLEPKSASQPINRPIIQDVSVLDESAVSSEIIAAHRMAADEPRVIQIPKLSLEARIRRVGISLTGEPIATGNIYDVGWFEASGNPGSTDAVLLNGHEAGPTKHGIFGNIRELVPGDEILLYRGDGTILKYKVSKVQEYPANRLDMSAAMQPLDPTKKGLNLMTTVNKFSARGHQTDKRVVIFALQ